MGITEATTSGPDGAGTFMPKRADSDSWRDANPILRPGELAVDTSTGQIKIGDGATAWNDLGHVGGATVDQDQQERGRVTVTGDHSDPAEVLRNLLAALSDAGIVDDQTTDTEQPVAERVDEHAEPSEV